VEEVYKAALDGKKNKAKPAKPEVNRGGKKPAVADEQGSARPIIDQSLPADAPVDDELFLFGEQPAGIDELPEIEADSGDKKSAALEEGEWAPIDLSPIVPADLRQRKNRQATLIGSKLPVSKERRERGGRGRKSKRKQERK
jgi:hypothetical protein